MNRCPINNYIAEKNIDVGFKSKKCEIIRIVCNIQGNLWIEMKNHELKMIVFMMLLQ